MSMLSVAVLSACLALSAAQLAPGPSGGSTTGPLGAAATTFNPGAAAGSNTGGSSSIGGGTGTGTSATNDPMGQMFRNPLMSYGLMGGDNLNRAFMMPFLSRMGGSNTANYYYLRGGMDNYASVMMSDMLGKLMARSMGMDPMLAAMFAGQMTDAPDNYALSNMLFNRRGAANAGGRQQGLGSGGFLPTGAASPLQQPPANNWLFG